MYQKTLNAPENKELIKKLNKAKPLNPRQLIQVAAHLSTRVPHQKSLAEYLAKIAMARIVRDPKFNKVIGKIENEEIGYHSVWVKFL